LAQNYVRFGIYVNGSLHATDTHPAGLESSDFCAKTVAMSRGLAALTDIKDLHSYYSIWIFTDCQSLTTTLSGGEARQSIDSICNSIWSHLSSLSASTSSGFQHTWDYLATNTLADLEAKWGKGSDQEDETRGVPCPLPR